MDLLLMSFRKGCSSACKADIRLAGSRVNILSMRSSGLSGISLENNIIIVTSSLVSHLMHTYNIMMFPPTICCIFFVVKLVIVTLHTQHKQEGRQVD